MLITALTATPTYTGSASLALTNPPQTLEDTVPNSRPFIVTPFSEFSASRLTTGEKISNVVGGILGALGVGVTADKNGVSVVPTTTTVQDKAAGIAYDKAAQWSPVLIAGIAVVVTVLLLRK